MLIVASSLLFFGWGATLTGDVAAAATVDRLIHHADVSALDGDACRPG